MQVVFVCGGKGTRLQPRHAGPKSLAAIGGSTLLDRLVRRFGPVHTSSKPPIVIVDARDEDTPKAVASVLPGAQLVQQPQPDGVANALQLAEPFMDDPMIVVLGDVFVDGAFSPFPRDAALTVWHHAPAGETSRNFAVATDATGRASAVIEKPAESVGLHCGMGVYVLTRAAIAAFSNAAIDRRTGERGITAGISAAIVAGIRFQTVSFSGYYSNVNCGADLAAVERYLAVPSR